MSPLQDTKRQYYQLAHLLGISGCPAVLATLVINMNFFENAQGWHH